MDIRQILKQSDTVVGLVRDTKRVLRLLSRFANTGPRQKIIRHYFASNETRKLQIGAGPSSLDGWLSTDIAPESDGVVYLDATERFPFDDNTVDYVYSEHMIEHISWHEGLFFLRESRRVLKPGGTIRIATPNLEVLLGLYSCNGDHLSDRYIKWITENYVKGVGVCKASFVINNAFRNWGHQFLYDTELMEMAMKEAGFISIRRCSPGESDDSNLRGIESHGTNVGDDDMATFETMVFEGTRACASAGYSGPQKLDSRVS